MKTNDLKIAKRRKEFVHEHRAVGDICGLALCYYYYYGYGY